MSTIARQAPRFPWDYDVPETAFWENLHYTMGRNFLSCYTEPEIAAMTFDDSLTQQAKLEHLRGVLNSTWSAKSAEAAPSSLHDVDYDTWVKLKLAFSCVEHYLGNSSTEEALEREMYENGPNGTKNMSALHQLSGLYEKVGRYGEAEAAANQVLPWMLGHKLLGSGSPQVLSCLRILAMSTWKQNKHAEAEGWIKKCEECLEDMGKGKFAKYQDEERKEFDDHIKTLRDWKGDV